MPACSVIQLLLSLPAQPRLSAVQSRFIPIFSPLMAALKQSPVAVHLQCGPSTVGHGRARVRAIPCTASLKSPSHLLQCGWPRVHISFTSPKAPGRRSGYRNRIVMQSTPAKSYAQAIADVARAKNALENVYNDFEKLEQLFTSKYLTDFLTNPVAEVEKKKSIIKAVADDAKLQPETLNFLCLLVDKQRMDLLKDIIAEFESVYNELTDTVVATVTTVIKPENEQLAEIAKIVQEMTGSKNVKIKNVLDASLVAGFTVKFGSSWVDMSVKTEMEQIAAQIGAKGKLEAVAA